MPPEMLDRVNEMGKPTKGAFDALGLSASDLQGKTFDEQLEKLAEGFNRIPDAAQRSAAAMDLFGRSGVAHQLGYHQIFQHRHPSCG